MGIDMGDFRMMAMSKHDHCEAIIVNEDLMKYSRYSSSYTSRSANPVMNSIRVGRASRRRSSSGIQVRRIPARSKRRGISHRRGKFIVVGMIVLGFLCASYFASASMESMVPSLSGKSGASATAALRSPNGNVAERPPSTRPMPNGPIRTMHATRLPRAAAVPPVCRWSTST